MTTPKTVPVAAVELGSESVRRLIIRCTHSCHKTDCAQCSRAQLIRRQMLAGLERLIRSVAARAGRKKVKRGK